MSTTFCLRNATLLTMNPDGDIVSGDLLVRDGRIEAVGAVDETAGVTTIDVGGDYVLPGFVQTHVHLCQVLFRHEAEDRPLLQWLQERIWPLEGAHDPDSLQASTRLGIGELLLGGTTCALDMGTVHHQDVIGETVDTIGFRAAIGKAMMDAGEDVPATLAETTRDSLDESARLARRWHGHDNDRIRYAFAPRFVLSCTDDLQREVARLSREHGYLIHTHSSEHPEEVAFVEATRGMRNVHLLDSLGLCSERSVFAHGVHLDDAERDTLARTCTSIAHCPSANLKLGSGIADTPRLLAAGVNVGIGADGAPCNNGLDAFVEMRLAMLLQGPGYGPGKGLSAREVLTMATIRGARSLGWEDRIGSLEVGKDADVVRLRRDDFRLGLGSDPYTEIVTAGCRDLVRDVWIRGRRMVAGGVLTGLDRAELLADGRTALRATMDRAGV